MYTIMTLLYGAIEPLSSALQMYKCFWFERLYDWLIHWLIKGAYISTMYES